MVAAAGQGALEGAWIVANRQTAGRGRMARDWVSPAGNLYASTLVRLGSDDPPAPTLAFVAAVALFDTLAAWAPAIQLKWPNDIMFGGAKLSGILLERAGDAVVLGFGVNLASHPDGLERPVTSFAAIGVTPIPMPLIVLDALRRNLVDGLQRWRSEGVTPVRTAWLARAHPMGTGLIVNLPDRAKLTGLFEGLTESCALRLRLADGELRVIHAGDVFAI